MLWDNTQRRSNLEFRSIGIVAQNKERGTNECLFWPIEILPNLDVELTTDAVDIRKNAVDFYEEEYYVAIKKGAVIPAKWMGETNRATSPDLRKGEQVELWQSGDSKRWFWKSMGRDEDLRREETVVYTFRAKPDIPDADPSPDDTYTLTVSAHDKHITLQTSQANGEACTYRMNFNLADGVFTLNDNVNNHIFLDSINKHIQMKNADATMLELNKKVINMNASDSVNITTKKVNINAKDTDISDNLTVGKETKLKDLIVEGLPKFIEVIDGIIKAAKKLV